MPDAVLQPAPVSTNSFAWRSMNSRSAFAVIARYSCLPGQERAQLGSRLGRVRLLERMPARHLPAGNARRALAPDRERVVTPRDGAALAPKHEQRALNFLVQIGAIVLEVDRCPGAVVLAHRVQRAGNPKHAPVFVTESLVLAADEEIEAVRDHGLGKRRGAREEEPMVGALRERLVDARE